MLQAMLCASLGATLAVAQPIQSVTVRSVTALDTAQFEPLGIPFRAEGWSDGRVVLVTGARVLLVNRQMTGYRMIADTGVLTPVGRPARTTLTTVAMRSDSVALVDPASGSLLIVDSTGHVARSVTLPSFEDVSAMAASGAHGASFDSMGRLVYRAAFHRAATRGGSPRPVGGLMDSFPVVRANLDARRVDTLATIHVTPSVRIQRASPGTPGVRATIHPLPTMDDWAILSTGELAIVRGHDYHVDWIAPDGRRYSTPKMPFPWRRLTDADKQRLVDSVSDREANRRRLEDSIAKITKRAQPTLAPQTPVRPNEVPDYYPPIRPGAVRADRDGYLWILPTIAVAANGGLLYDVVSPDGSIVERVRLPEKCALAGFGPARVVYLSCLGTLVRGRIAR